MYYPVSDTIATEHPDLAEDVRTLDAFLRDNRGESVRASRIAAHVNIESRALKYLLSKFQEAGVIHSVTLRLCPRCDVVIDDSGECDLCEVMYRADALPTEEGYILADLGSPKDGTAPKMAELLTRVLFIAGDRGGSRIRQIQGDKEFKAIQGAIRGSRYRDDIYLLNPILSATRQELAITYRDRPDVVHFAGHGDDHVLAVIEDHGLLVRSAPLNSEQLIAILRCFESRVRLCILNACRSASLARALVRSDVVDAAVGWGQSLNDVDAIAFSHALYAALGDGRPIETAVSVAGAACEHSGRAVLEARTGFGKQVIVPSRGE